MNCLKCGSPNPEDAVFCNKCGSKIEPYRTSFRGQEKGEQGNKKILILSAVIAMIVLGAAMYFLLMKGVEPQKADSSSEKSGPESDYIREVK